MTSLQNSSPEVVQAQADMLREMQGNLDNRDTDWPD